MYRGNFFRNHQIPIFDPAWGHQDHVKTRYFLRFASAASCKFLSSKFSNISSDGSKSFFRRVSFAESLEIIDRSSTFWRAVFSTSWTSFISPTFSSSEILELVVENSLIIASVNRQFRNWMLDKAGLVIADACSAIFGLKRALSLSLSLSRQIKMTRALSPNESS